jgi:hypothetical protein
LRKFHFLFTRVLRMSFFTFRFSCCALCTHLIWWLDNVSRVNVSLKNCVFTIPCYFCPSDITFLNNMSRPVKGAWRNKGFWGFFYLAAKEFWSLSKSLRLKLRICFNGSKREMFVAGIFTEIRLVWVSDLETLPKNLKSFCLGPYITLYFLGFLL